MARDTVTVSVLAKVEGGEQLRAELLKRRGQVIVEMRGALPDEGAALLAAANAAAPVASGTLRGTAVLVPESKQKETETKVRIEYTSHYAAAVHEGIHWGKKVAGTKGFKWMERATQAFESAFVERIAGRLAKLLGGK
jgi:hypothetical protein